MMDLKQKVFEHACEHFFFKIYVRSIDIQKTSEVLGVSKYKVRKAVKELVSDGMLEVIKTPGFWTEDGVSIPPTYRYIITKEAKEIPKFNESYEKALENIEEIPF